MKGTTFLKGALILTLAGIMVKVLGAANRILLSRMLGGEGIGLYQMSYPIYILFLSIIGAGIPIAVSIMIADEAAKGTHGHVQGVFRVILTFVVGIAILCGILFALSAHVFIAFSFVRDDRALPSLLILAPALTLSIIACSFRGYFQGLQQMIPTAISQIADQGIRVLTMLVFAAIGLSHGLMWGAVGAAAGAIPGAIAGTVVIIGWYYYQHRPKVEAAVTVSISSSMVIKRLITLAIPVAAANMLLPLIASIDLFIVPKQLEVAGYTVHEATALFGYLSGMANGVIQVPAILTIALATNLVPAVSSAYTQGNIEVITSRMNTSIRLAHVITIPAFCGLSVLAVPISILLYNAPLAGPAIRVLSISIVLLGMQQLTSGLLQGMGRTAIPLWNMIIGAIVKVFLSWHLTAMPTLGEVGAAWATNADLAIAAGLNLYFARKLVHYQVPWKYLGRVCIAAIIMTVVVGGIYVICNPYMGNAMATILAIILGVICYGISLFAVKAVRREDVGHLPFIHHHVMPSKKEIE